MSDVEGPVVKMAWTVNEVGKKVININRVTSRGGFVGEYKEEEKKKGRKKKTEQSVVTQQQWQQQTWTTSGVANAAFQQPHQQALPQQWQNQQQQLPPQWSNQQQQLPQPQWPVQQQQSQNPAWVNSGGYPQQQPAHPFQPSQPSQQPYANPYFQQTSGHQQNGSNFQPATRSMTFHGPDAYSEKAAYTYAALLTYPSQSLGGLPPIDEHGRTQNAFEPRLLSAGTRCFSDVGSLDPMTAPPASLEYCLRCRIRLIQHRFQKCGHGYCETCDKAMPDPDDVDYCPECIKSQRNRCLRCKVAAPSATCTFLICKHGYCADCDDDIPEPDDMNKCDSCQAVSF